MNAAICSAEAVRQESNTPQAASRPARPRFEVRTRSASSSGEELFVDRPDVVFAASAGHRVREPERLGPRGPQLAPVRVMPVVSGDVGVGARGPDRGGVDCIGAGTAGGGKGGGYHVGTHTVSGA